MITFTLDKSNNQIVVKMSGSISVDEAARSLNEVANACKELQDNFVFINDISELHFDSEAKLITLNKVHMKMLDLFKIKKFIRVIGKSKDLLTQLSKIDKGSRLEQGIISYHFEYHNIDILIPRIKSKLAFF